MACLTDTETDSALGVCQAHTYGTSFRIICVVMRNWDIQPVPPQNKEYKIATGKPELDRSCADVANANGERNRTEEQLHAHIECTSIMHI